MLTLPFDCINDAALLYHVPAKLIIAVLQTENGNAGKITYNKNGTYDIGPMAINSIWLPELKKRGIKEDTLQNDICTNITTGTWILSKKIAEEDNVMVGIGDYHSHSFKLNQSYSVKVKKHINYLNELLDGV